MIVIYCMSDGVRWAGFYIHKSDRISIKGLGEQNRQTIFQCVFHCRPHGIPMTIVESESMARYVSIWSRWLNTMQPCRTLLKKGTELTNNIPKPPARKKNNMLGRNLHESALNNTLQYAGYNLSPTVSILIRL